MRESALSSLSHHGNFVEIERLLKAGANPEPLGWTQLHHAVALGTLYAVKASAAGGLDLEARDGWERTPFLLAVHTGDIAKASHLLDSGASRHVTGHYGKPALMYPLHHDNVEMLTWLIEHGFDIDACDGSGTTALLEAAELGAVDCFHALLDAGADDALTDSAQSTLIGNASHPEIIATLLARGENPAKLDTDVLRDYIGLGTEDQITVTESAYRAGRERTFGRRNPQPIDNPFWIGMVRCGWSAYRADDHFDNRSYDSYPTWCHDRFGMSLTPLPDGRFVQIAGEHEDFYHSDFCIYNDVIVHDGKGGFQIYGYPREVFPPIDFHTATLVGEWIYIIGSLGYIDERGSRTPVYRLNVNNFVIERVVTSGEDPGWISRHKATLVEDRIEVTGGKRYLPARSGGSRNYVDRSETHVFDVAQNRWIRPA